MQVTRVLVDHDLQVVSRAQVRGVRWLSRIDQEGFFGVRFLEGAERLFSVWATRLNDNKKEQGLDR